MQRLAVAVLLLALGSAGASSLWRNVRPQAVAGQDVTLEERVAQLETRLTLVESRLSIVEDILRALPQAAAPPAASAPTPSTTTSTGQRRQPIGGFDSITIGPRETKSYRLWREKPDQPLRGTIEVCAQEYAGGTGPLQVNFVALERGPSLTFDGRSPPCQTVQVIDAYGVIFSNSGTGRWQVRMFTLD